MTPNEMLLQKEKKIFGLDFLLLQKTRVRKTTILLEEIDIPGQKKMPRQLYRVQKKSLLKSLRLLRKLNFFLHSDDLTDRQRSRMGFLKSPSKMSVPRLKELKKVATVVAKKAVEFIHPQPEKVLRLLNEKTGEVENKINGQLFDSVVTAYRNAQGQPKTDTILSLLVPHFSLKQLRAATGLSISRYVCVASSHFLDTNYMHNDNMYFPM
jgi:hypothetical protein